MPFATVFSQGAAQMSLTFPLAACVLFNGSHTNIMCDSTKVQVYSYADAGCRTISGVPTNYTHGSEIAPGFPITAIYCNHDDMAIERALWKPTLTPLDMYLIIGAGVLAMLWVTFMILWCCRVCCGRNGNRVTGLEMI